MRYIKNDLFTKHSGKPFLYDDTESEVAEHEATISEVLSLALNFYDKQHLLFVIRDSKALSPKETEAFNDALTILEADPTEGQYHALAPEQFDIVKKVVGWAVPLMSWWRGLPTLEELLNRAPNKLPTGDHVGEPPDEETAGTNGQGKVRVEA